ncbi:MAG TPA: hypothetical protein VNX68_11485, partial [Nitrosopumilaceae archaeon]|nr:hypothetical protein [Nitrosopumilaceae archaeon]
MNSGNDYLADGNYTKALDEFIKAYNIDSSNANINFKVGYCYLFHPKQKHLAEKFLERATKDATIDYNEENPMFKKAPVDAYLLYGEALHLDYKFDEALKMYDLYTSHLDKTKFKEEIAEVDHFKTTVNNARTRVAKPAKILVTDMGDSINSEFPEYSPLLSADERMMIFTYRGNRVT